MWIKSISSETIHYIPYCRAGANGITEKTQLPIMHGVVDTLPPSLEAIICTGDLQGVDINHHFGSKPKLLGQILADELLVLLEILSISPRHTGIILSGDFYSVPLADKRGASGDVRQVWNAFLEGFRWVAGILGNHDQMGSTAEEFEAFTQQPNLYFFDGDSQIVDGLVLAGISGIIGNPTKPLRRSAKNYQSILAQLNKTRPDLMILHPSPSISRSWLSRFRRLR